jgi:uncharacterized protein (TIGR03083 family)
MPDDPVFTAAAEQRRGLADLVESLDEAQLATPSLCAGWDVRTVAGHLVAPLILTPRSLVTTLVRARGSLDTANTLMARDVARRPVSELAALLRQHAGSSFAPPVTGPRGPLTDALVHGGDMRLPLGIPHDPAPAAVRHCLDFVTAGRPIGFLPRGRLRGLRLQAADQDWAWGEGDAVTGRGIDLLMAACGRTATLPALAGPGSALLAERL